MYENVKNPYELMRVLTQDRISFKVTGPIIIPAGHDGGVGHVLHTIVPVALVLPVRSTVIQVYSFITEYWGESQQQRFYTEPWATSIEGDLGWLVVRGPNFNTSGNGLQTISVTVDNYRDYSSGYDGGHDRCQEILIVTYKIDTANS